MHSNAVPRRALLGALVALTLLVGTLLTTAPKASADLSQCAADYVCVWENTNYTGNFSQWPFFSSGCHSHTNNPNIRSAWNRTGFTVQMGGQGSVGPGNTWQIFGTSVTGLICW